MKWLAISCVAVLCLAPHRRYEEPVRAQDQKSTRVFQTIGDNPKADFVGGGVIQDSCHGKVSFSSKLNHIGNSKGDRLLGLDEIHYEVILADSEKMVFSGRWWWEATPDFMADYRVEHRIDLNDPHEDMDIGEYGSDEGWQEACEERSTDISQCDRIFNEDMDYPYYGRLTGEGDPENPRYYEIIFNFKTKAGCILKWTDRLLFQFDENWPD